MDQSETRAELYGLQILRGLAATMVVVHHALEESRAASLMAPDWLTLIGAAGVDLFFVISGFIMVYTSFKGEQPRLSARLFLFRRASRVLPLYWIACGTMLLLMVSGHLHHHRPDVQDIFLSLILFPTHNPLIGVSWTLVYEAFFYVLFALSLLVGTRKGTIAVQCALLLLALIVGPHVSNPTLSAFLSQPIMLEFALGMGLALAVRRLELLGFGLRVGVLAAGVLMLIAGTILGPHTNTNGLAGPTRLVLWGLSSAVITAACVVRGRRSGIIRDGLVQVGNASYSIYLTHVFVMLAYAVALKSTHLASYPQQVIACIVILGALLLGLLVHWWVEAPIERKLRGIMRMRPPVGDRRGAW